MIVCIQTMHVLDSSHNMQFDFDLCFGNANGIEAYIR